MAVPFSNTKLRVPRGFRNVLEGFSREVLRSQPSDIYAFGSLYFEKLLQIRAESGVDPVEVGAQEEDRFYNNKAYARDAMLQQSDPDKELAAIKIQTKYRQYTAKKVLRELREEKAALKIQCVYRGHLAREFARNVKKCTETMDTAAMELARTEDEEEEEREGDSPSKVMIPDSPDKKNADKSEDSKKEEASTPVEKKVEVVPESVPEEQEQEAEKKNEVKEEKEEKGEEEEEEGKDEIISDVEDAAARIQAGMRGVFTRRTLKGQQMLLGAQTGEEEKEGQKGDGERGESGTKDATDEEETEEKE